MVQVRIAHPAGNLDESQLMNARRGRTVRFTHI